MRYELPDSITTRYRHTLRSFGCVYHDDGTWDISEDQLHTILSLATYTENRLQKIEHTYNTLMAERNEELKRRAIIRDEIIRNYEIDKRDKQILAAVDKAEREKVRYTGD